MLNFKEVGLEDRELLEPVFHAQPFRICDQNFACLYLWQLTYPASYCFDEGILYIRYIYPDGTMSFQLPYCSADRLPQAVEKLRAYTESMGKDLVFSVMNEDQKTILSQAMPGSFEYGIHPEYADYIYNAQDLITLRGKKFHSKRNFVNRFRENYEGRFAFEYVSKENRDEVLALNAQWDAENLGSAIGDEADAVERAINDLEKIGMFGVALRLDGRIVAFALGTRLCADTVLEQIEKSADITGGYQMINQAFAERFASDCKYINREEDLGIEGLRKAKLSYNPAYLNMRYHGVLRK